MSPGWGVVEGDCGTETETYGERSIFELFSILELLLESVPVVLGSITSHFHDVTFPWCHITVMSHLYNGTFPCRHASMTSCFHSIVFPWHLVSMTTCFHDIMFPQHCVSMASCFHDNTFPWRVSMVTHFHSVTLSFRGGVTVLSYSHTTWVLDGGLAMKQICACSWKWQKDTKVWF